MKVHELIKILEGFSAGAYVNIVYNGPEGHTTIACDYYLLEDEEIKQVNLYVECDPEIRPAAKKQTKAKK